MWNEARANDQSRKGASLSGGAQSPCRQDAVSSLRAALDAIAHSWPLVKRREAFHPTPAWTTSGLALGMGTILAQTVRGQEERVLALLSVAFDKAWPPSILDALTRAQGAWREGKIAESAMHIALANFPRLVGEPSGYRLYVAACLLDRAFITPFDLMKIRDLDTSGIEALRKYSPDQPRVPGGAAGGGQWTSDGGTASASNPQLHAQPKRSPPSRSSARQSATILRTCEGAAQACTNRYFNTGLPSLSACISAYDTCMGSGLITIFAPGIIGQR